jgi:hypothetical protein
MTRFSGRLRMAGIVCAILRLILSSTYARPEVPAAPGEARLQQLVEANIIAVHAYQLQLARKQGNIDVSCWPLQAPPDAELQRLVEHQSSLLATPVAAVKAWAEGQDSSFNPSRDLEPLLEAKLPMSPTLPVSVFTNYLQKAAPYQAKSHIRSVANLYQTVLEVERDGDRLQELFAFYIGLGLPVYVGQFGLPGNDADFLAVGRILEGPSCLSPVGLSAGEWQIAGRKIWNWAEKNLHIRDANVLAKELLAEPEVVPLIPKMKSLPAERVAIIGHSYTMDLHWSSPSAFVPIVTAMFARENPKVEFRQFQAGGLTSSRAYRRFYQDALAWKPSIVLLVLINRTDQDRSDLRKMAAGFRAAGTRVLMFDNLFNNDDSDQARLQANLSVARDGGIQTDHQGVFDSPVIPRPRTVLLSRPHPHDRALPPSHGQAVVEGVARRFPGSLLRGDLHTSSRREERCRVLVEVNSGSRVSTQDRRRCVRTDLSFEAGRNRRRLSRIGHDTNNFVSFQDLSHAHGDCSTRNFGKTLEPSFTELLPATSFVQIDDQIRLLSIKICGWIVESQVPVFTNSDKCHINRTAG